MVLAQKMFFVIEWLTSHFLGKHQLLIKERFDALFDYCGGNWKDKKIAEIEHDGLNKEGIPINPVVVAVREWDL